MNSEQWPHLHEKDLTPEEIHTDVVATLAAEFKQGRISTEDEPRSKCPRVCPTLTSGGRWQCMTDKSAAKYRAENRASSTGQYLPSTVKTGARESGQADRWVTRVLGIVDSFQTSHKKSGVRSPCSRTRQGVTLMPRPNRVNRSSLQLTKTASVSKAMVRGFSEQWRVIMTGYFSTSGGSTTLMNCCACEKPSKRNSRESLARESCFSKTTHDPPHPRLLRPHEPSRALNHFPIKKCFTSFTTGMFCSPREEQKYERVCSADKLVI